MAKLNREMWNEVPDITDPCYYGGSEGVHYGGAMGDCTSKLKNFVLRRSNLTSVSPLSSLSQ